MRQLIFLLLCLSSFSNFAADSSDRLQSKLNAIRSMSAAFKQVIHAKNRQISSSQGSMALLRPGRFRWQTNAPLEQLVLADGQHLWVYDVDLEQVTVRKQGKSLGGTAALFLSQNDEALRHDFSVSSYTAEGKDYFDLQAKSKQASFQRVKLLFIESELRMIELFDPMGQRTEVRFSHVKNNTRLAASLFQFKRPNGVDVVEQ